MGKLNKEIKNIVEYISYEKNPINLTAIVEGKAIYNVLLKRVEVDINESPVKRCWRLINVKGKEVHFFESGGSTGTIWDLFCGTEEECRTEAKRLGLTIIEDGDEGEDI